MEGKVVKNQKHQPVKLSVPKKRNINFEISILQAETGLQPKIARCKKVVEKKHGGKLEAPLSGKAEKLQSLLDEKRKHVEFHLCKTAHRLIKTCVSSESRNLTKRLKSLKELQERREKEGLEIEKAKEAALAKAVAIEKLAKQAEALKIVSAELLEKALFEATECEDKWEDILTRLTGVTPVPNTPEHTERVVQQRILNSKAITQALPDMRVQRARVLNTSTENKSNQPQKGEKITAKTSKQKTETVKTAKATDDILSKLASKAKSGSKKNKDLVSSEEEEGISEDEDMSDIEQKYANLDDERDMNEEFSGSESEDEPSASFDPDPDVIFMSSLSDMGTKKAEKPQQNKKGKQPQTKEQKQKKPQKKKNRPGQQARQALWEKEYGAAAKHLKEGKKSKLEVQVKGAKN
eukprot:Ihof_evm9s74 gene=Ihof_evmTU9s74